MSDNPGSVSVVVVNYGTARLALEAIASVLRRDHGGRLVDVHVVDNASPGDDAAQIGRAIAERGWQDRVFLHAEAENHGFGRANNLVFEALARRESPPEFVFLLNPDAALENEAVDILARALEARPDAACAGARVSEPGRGPVTAAFRFPSPISVFVAALNVGPVSRLFAHRSVWLDPELPESRVDWVTGAAVMIRFAPLRAVGGFDPAFFLYHEEVDLMRRLGNAGWQTWFIPDARIVHDAGAATGQNRSAGRARSPAYLYQSWLHYFLASHGPARTRLAALGWVAGAALNGVYARILRKTPRAPERFYRDFWAVIGRPLLGLRARPYE